ncbi:MAG: DNA polymerase III subunit gamma/tau [Betaproteobacteria bacterium]|nr:DNA polymerase III subunit gamma/tau [Betaproteobacteria bacterium]
MNPSSSHHQVLARKWRPKTFVDLVGQSHVVRALANALESGRLHHAYLFTGTRGVGKTTLARILARCLNCETGVTATPCGTCSACQQIDAGRFVDLIEIDAASYTGVDNMREILENAQYAPTAGRYKVYIIDEVHMLSKNAFNAMLKTLEEPPGHVVFILATTDPQKVPVTVLSRCLQFNLKQMPTDLVTRHLKRILDAEEVNYEAEALSGLARAAAGSMRDALSLTDQAIAYGQGQLKTDETRAMLGAVDSAYLLPLLEALAVNDGLRLMAEAETIAERSLSFDAALQDLALLLHQIALIQVVPDALDSDLPDHARLEALAEQIDAETTQLYYQIATLGRRDLEWAPDPLAGFRMTLLRMLAFVPDSHATAAPQLTQPSTPKAAPRPAMPTPEAAPLTPKVTAPAAAPSAPAAARETPPATQTSASSFDGNWFTLSQRLNGGLKQLASQCELVAHDAHSITLRLPESARPLLGSLGNKLTNAIRDLLGAAFKIDIQIGATQGSAPAEVLTREKNERQSSAEADIYADPTVQTLMRDFDATVIDISPLNKV